jgi:hypothetical protein
VQDPERLLEQGSEFERLLLAGGIAERPSSTLTRRMALGAGLGGALSYTSSAKALMQTWWGKTVAFASVGVGVAGAIAVGAQLSAGADDLPAAPLAVSAPPVALTTLAEPPASSDASKASDAADSGVSERASTPLPASEAVATKRMAPSVKAGGTLAQEIKALDRARGSMTRGDRAGALAELDSYDRRYPAGTLKREARVLRARAIQAP